MNTLDNVVAEDLEKHKTLLDRFLAEDRIWNLASHADPFVRRSIYRLLLAALKNKERDLDMRSISRNMLSSSLHVDQLGSTFDYAKALAFLTKHCPEVWTTLYTGSGKQSARRRICQFLKKGSQGSTPEFWSHITVLLRQIPISILAPGSEGDGTAKPSDDVASLRFPVLDALHDGLCSKDEPRANLPAAWKTYLDLASRVQPLLVQEETVPLYYNKYILPILHQYIIPSNEWWRWTLPKSEQLGLCANAFLQTWRGMELLMKDVWRNLSVRLIENMKTSLPEQSKDYIKSQETISEASRRWYGLQAAVMKENGSQSIRSLFIQTLSSELSAAMDSLKTRNGKPYGAAATLVAAMQLTPGSPNVANEIKKLVISFARDEVPKILMSPSAPYFLTLLGLVKNEVDVSQIYKSSLKSIQKAPESAIKSKTLQSILASDYLAIADNDTLTQIVDDYLQAALVGDSNSWGYVLTAMQNPAAAAGLVHRVLSTMTDAISTDDKLSTGIHGMNLLTQKSQRYRQMLVSFSDGTQLLSRLLYLVESPNKAIAQNAQSISAALESRMPSGQSSDQAIRSRQKIINQGLESPASDSLSSVAHPKCSIMLLLIYGEF